MHALRCVIGGSPFHQAMISTRPNEEELNEVNLNIIIIYILYGQIQMRELWMGWKTHIHGASDKALPQMQGHEHKEAKEK